MNINIYIHLLQIYAPVGHPKTGYVSGAHRVGSCICGALD